MTDVALFWSNTNGGGDIALASADLATDDGMRTALIISLFSDGEARADDVIPDGSDDRRGWWGDAFADIQDDLIGSRLWLLSREKRLPAVLVKAHDFAREAVQWLIDDGVCARIDVDAELFGQDGLAIRVQPFRPSGPAYDRFDFVWEAI